MQYVNSALTSDEISKLMSTSTPPDWLGSESDQKNASAIIDSSSAIISSDATECSLVSLNSCDITIFS